MALTQQADGHAVSVMVEAAAAAAVVDSAAAAAAGHCRSAMPESCECGPGRLVSDREESILVFRVASHVSPKPRSNSWRIRLTSDSYGGG